MFPILGKMFALRSLKKHGLFGIKSLNKRLKSSSKKNLAAVLYAAKDLRVEERPIPNICVDEVLLAMDCVGVCGTDVHFWVEGSVGDFIVKKPIILGHEASGVVAQCGKEVKNLVVGDRVAIEPGVPCRVCHFCKIGKYHLCPDTVFCASPPDDGNLTNFFPHAADFCYKLPSHVTMEEGALVEPVSVGVHGCRAGKVTIGSKVLILGAGPVGLANMIVAKAMGADLIIITDKSESRLETAKCMGADHTVMISKDKSLKDTTNEIKKIIPAMPDVTIDCFGNGDTVSLGVASTRSGGRLVLQGLHTSHGKVPIMDACIREIHLVGAFRYGNDTQDALELVASGRVDPKPLVTHHFDIKDSVKAFEVARDGSDGAIKVMIHCQKRDKNNKQPFKN